MKDNLQLKLKPFIDSFIDQLCKIEEQYQSELSSLSSQNVALTGRTLELNDRERELQAKYDTKLQSLDADKERLAQAIQDADSEIQKARRMQDEAEVKLKQVDQSLKDAQTQRDIATNVLNEAKNEAEKITAKKKELETYEAELSKKNKELSNTENRITKQREALDVKEAKVLEKEKKLEEDVVDYKLARKNLELEIKRTRVK